jgi:hypothetical protein
VLHLGNFARALRLRWLWQEWTSPEKAWIGTGVPCDEADKTLFATCTSVTIGDGSGASFWHSGWLQENRPKDIAPLLFAKSRKKKRNVASALHENTWIRDLQHLTGLTPAHLLEFVTLWNLVDQSRLQPQQEDKITWTLTPKGEYTTSSAYKAQFHGYAANPALAAIWMGTPKMQVLRMAHPTGSRLDVGQTSPAALGPQSCLSALQNHSGDGNSPLGSVSIHTPGLVPTGHVDRPPVSSSHTVDA